LTRAGAEARLATILAGQDAAVCAIPKVAGTFGDAADEWLRYFVIPPVRNRTRTKKGFSRAQKYAIVDRALLRQVVVSEAVMMPGCRRSNKELRE